MRHRGLSGQSAIEYLMTYGWMLLVVAVVGGAIFSVAQRQCTENVSGFAGSDVRVDNFGSTSTDKLQVELRNTGAEDSDIQRITFEQDGKRVEIGSTRSIDVSETKVYSTDGLVESSSCNTIDVSIVYDKGGLSDLVASGTITTSGEVIDLAGEASNLPQNDLQMRFDAMTIGRTDGTEINKWIDLTNGQNNATGINSSRLPEVEADGINGYQSLYFNSSTKDILTMSHKDYLSSQNHTMFAVADIYPESYGGATITSKYVPGSRVNTIATTNQKPRVIYRDEDGGYISGTGSKDITDGGNLFAIRANYNGSRSKVEAFLNGTSQVSDTSSKKISLNTAAVSIGAVKYPGGGFNDDFWEIEGEVGEIIYYNKTLNSSEMDEVESYLSEKWDLGIE